MEKINKFLEEVKGQAKALEDTLSYLTDGQGAEALQALKSEYGSMRYQRVIFTGMGSSFFLSQSAASLLNGDAIPAVTINASELLHYQRSILDEHTLLVCISQSGESFEIVELLKSVESATVVSITNEPKSYLALHSNICLLTKAGKEEMTSSKTFVTGYMAVYALAQYLSGKWDEESIEALRRVSAEVEHLLKDEQPEWLEKAIDLLSTTTFVQLIGRGPVFATVSQSALMFMEATATAASGMLGGEFRHGPMEMVNDTFHAIVFATNDGTYNQSQKMASDIIRFGGKVIFVTNGQPLLGSSVCNICLSCPENELFPIVAIVPLQQLVNRWALEHHLTPGMFGHGAKVTTIE
jgi:glucosamine--fructose-6-phosphate aminotransferase (isomerizing)